MIPHLHLHLEPEERKRRTVGGIGQASWTAPTFFADHQLDKPGRLVLAIDDIIRFVRDVWRENQAHDVGYIELRISPRRFISDGLHWPTIVTMLAAAAFELSDPTLRFVLLINRDSPRSFIEEMTGLVQADLPPAFVGLDLAGDEQAYPDVARFVDLFDRSRRAGLGVSVHAGEFARSAVGVWDAIEKLGATRIGHGLAAASDRRLMARMTRDQILAEVSISSNLSLGAVRANEEHPVVRMAEAGVPVCFNTDIPLLTGATMRSEMVQASHALGVDLADVCRLQSDAMKHAFKR